MLLRALIWRPLRQDLSRTLLSLAAVALGVAVVVGIRIANRSAIASFQRSAMALAGNADLLITGPQPMAESRLQNLLALGNEAEFVPYVDRLAFDPQHQDSLDILGLDLVGTGSEYGTGVRAETSQPGLLLPAAYAQRHQVRPGDTLSLVVGGRAIRILVAAVLPATRAAASDFAVLDLRQAMTAMHLDAFDGLRVQLAPGVDPVALIRRLTPLLPNSDRVVTPNGQARAGDQMLAAFHANLTALAYVSLLVGVFLIYNTVSISVVRRRTAVATLRALGASRARVLQLFLAEGAVIAAAGGVAGWGLGWLLARVALAAMERTVSNLYMDVGGGRVIGHAADGLWALGLALAAGLLAAWGPARQAALAAPAQGLRPAAEEGIFRARIRAALIVAAILGIAAWALAQVPARDSIPLGGYGSALCAVLALTALTGPLLAVVLPQLRALLLRRQLLAAGLAAGSLAGALRRSSILTAALATAIGVMLGVAIMVGSFRQTVAVWLGQQLQADVFVRAVDWDRDRPVALPSAVLAAASATPGVAAIEASHSQTWEFRQQPVSLNVRWAWEGPARSAQFDYLAGAAGPLTVSEPLARRFHLAVGDMIVLDAPYGPLHLRVSGIFYDYATDRGLLELAPGAFARGFGSATVTEIGLDAAAGVSAAELRRRFETQLSRAGTGSGLVVNDNASLRAAAMHIFDQTFRITDALELITLIVAILGVGNTLLAVVLERGREFAILRFLGASRTQLRHLLLAEAGVVATLALGLGSAIAIALAVILVRVVNVQSFGWTIQFGYPWGFLVPAAIAVWLATLAAGWFPARVVQRQDALLAVQAE